MVCFVQPPAQTAPPAAPASPAGSAQAAEAVLNEVRTRMKAVQEAFTLHISFGKPRASFDPHLGPMMDSFETRLQAEKRPEVRHALLVAKLYMAPRAGVKVTPELRQAVVAELPPTSPAWSLEPRLLLSAVGAMTDEKAADAYLAQAREHHADPGVRGPLIYAQFEEGFFRKDEAQWKSALEKLDKAYAKEPYAREAHRTVDFAAKTAIGITAPAFSIKSLEDPKTIFTNGSFAGKYLLLDFWATWCGPCRGEMPQLHAAFAKYKDKGLRVLSLSFDQKPEDIAPYRADLSHAMPWNHAFVEEGFRSPLAEAYGVRGIPKPILVGPDGRILATESDLRGANLDKTLEKHLGKP
ncbi:MAG: TlpA family protein disulfide reductase [Holophagaceae bacterium]|nr:TlpA family protein disulfide reductase [Holophagaceae bacterium]